METEINNNEYIKKRYGGCYRSPIDENELRISDMILNKSPADLPKEFNLIDKCPEPRDQGRQNSCGGFAGALLRQMHLDDINTQLSPAFLYWQSRSYNNQANEDCGTCIRDILRTLKEFGISEEKYMPYDEKDYSTPPSKQAYENAKMYKINNYINIDNGISGIKSYLYTKKKPVIFGMEVYDSFIEETGKTGIAPIPKEGDRAISGHSSVIIGWRNNTFKDNLISVFNHKRSKYGYFVVLNSYGQNWGGNKGVFYLPYEYIYQNNAYDFYIISVKGSQEYKSEIIK